jgi:hypothetical protein
MKLDRNINPDGKGKYALVLLRKLVPGSPQEESVNLLRSEGIIDDGASNPFFVIRYRDRFASSALVAYSYAVSLYAGTLPPESTTRGELKEYADEILNESKLATAMGTRTPD